MLRAVSPSVAWLALLTVGTALALQGHSTQSMTGPQTLAETTVTHSVLTTDGHSVGPVQVTVSLMRGSSGVRLQATWAYDLPFPATANGQLTLLGRDGQVFARSNPRQLATLRANVPQATLTTPFVDVPTEQSGALCGQADLNIWYDFQTGAASPRPAGTPTLTPTTFHVRVCAPDQRG
ncbi:hypothetical protein DESA109040_19840 [Deinococcus saxicola]|uniref:hypothetical protein n=1 Tax=Deinococcus saxicola TaxID=249406 RepID=UPI0039F09A3D